MMPATLGPPSTTLMQPSPDLGECEGTLSQSPPAGEITVMRTNGGAYGRVPVVSWRHPNRERHGPRRRRLRLPVLRRGPLQVGRAVHGMRGVEHPGGGKRRASPRGAGAGAWIEVARPRLRGP